VSKHFGGVAALAEVDFEIKPAEHVALVGDNGAGKSTLVNVLSGVLRLDAGHVWLNGIECHFRSPRDAKVAGIETVYQNLALVDQLDVVANLFLGREERLLQAFALSVLDRKLMARRAPELLARTGVKIPNLAEPVINLSGGQRQGVAIARAAGWGSKLIIMDEPTAALGVRETRSVEEVIAGLKRQGIAVLIISHNLRQAFELADSIWVMRRGRMVGHLITSECKPTDIVRLITGDEQASASEYA
jgi:fructose transport system ATP-binding protein